MILWETFYYATIITVLLIGKMRNGAIPQFLFNGFIESEKTW